MPTNMGIIKMSIQSPLTEVSRRKSTNFLWLQFTALKGHPAHPGEPRRFTHSEQVACELALPAPAAREGNKLQPSALPGLKKDAETSCTAGSSSSGGSYLPTPSHASEQQWRAGQRQPSMVSTCLAHVADKGSNPASCMVS